MQWIAPPEKDAASTNEKRPTTYPVGLFLPTPACLRGFVRILADFHFLHSVTFCSQFSLSLSLLAIILWCLNPSIGGSPHLRIYNHRQFIDYMRTYQRGLIGELVGEGE